jgi:hypothetical protein
MAGAVATFLAGSPFRYMKCIGELAPITFGASFLIIDERCLHHDPIITEKHRLLSTPKDQFCIFRENTVPFGRTSHYYPETPL